MPEITWTIAAAAGALGTAAFGVAEGLKRLAWIGEAGFPTILRLLGPMTRALAVAYGQDVETLLRAQYRGDQRELARVIRQGTRIGLTPENASAMANAIGWGPDLQALLTRAATALNTGQELPPDLRNVLGRFELAVDARIDAALTLAQNQYANTVRFTASAIAVSIALIVGLVTGPGWSLVPEAAVIGFLAVPLAPVAKDVVAALKSASEALRARS